MEVLKYVLLIIGALSCISLIWSWLLLRKRIKKEAKKGDMILSEFFEKNKRIFTLFIVLTFVTSISTLILIILNTLEKIK